MTKFRPRRSVLYVPADKPRAIEKARTLAADAIILDLEDAVLPETKAETREALRVAVASLKGEREVIVRVNGLETDFATEDMLAAVGAGADAILVPKITGAADVRTAAAALADADSSARLWVMMETPKALLSVAEIAAAAEDSAVPLDCLVLGTNDIVLETRVAARRDRAPLVPWLSDVVLAARAFGLDVIDGVLNDFRDAARLEEECRQARDLGMDGKSVIHPSQIETANRIFTPGEAEIAEARAIVEAFARPENAGRGVIAVDGQMVERLHLGQAERLLGFAEAFARRGAA
ncbi:HpcH/HpaI aldolase/citrate lyase family protein [Propylenella binzhouense]|uniref:CoA ester lyase n=1 Tax=Propylenella binzhouense TaxID=2555902 RepID=A0A964WTN7_9HYPH|nr:CoA ester lyase [Propylenella binzhouense]MYZ48171.1 CoA ester lyase [Propylenella binzhouense]